MSGIFGKLKSNGLRRSRIIYRGYIPELQIQRYAPTSQWRKYTRNAGNAEAYLRRINPDVLNADFNDEQIDLMYQMELSQAQYMYIDVSNDIVSFAAHCKNLLSETEKLLESARREREHIAEKLLIEEQREREYDNGRLGLRSLVQRRGNRPHGAVSARETRRERNDVGMTEETSHTQSENIAAAASQTRREVSPSAETPAASTQRSESLNGSERTAGTGIIDLIERTRAGTHTEPVTESVSEPVSVREEQPSPVSQERRSKDDTDIRTAADRLRAAEGAPVHRGAPVIDIPRGETVRITSEVPDPITEGETGVPAVHRGETGGQISAPAERRSKDDTDNRTAADRLRAAEDAPIHRGETIIGVPGVHRGDIDATA